MGSASDSRNSLDDLRRRAEARLKRQAEGVEALSKKDLQLLAHELQTYKLELEMQNEELSRAQQELQRSRDNYADLYDFAPVGYFAVDRRGRIDSVNLTGASLLGVDRSNLTGKVLSKFVAKEDSERFSRHLQSIFAEKDGLNHDEFRMKRADGNVFTAELQCVMSFSDRLCRIAMLDISLRKQAEEELISTLEELKRSNTELEQFAYVASHDLQEPLRMVTAFLQLIERKYHEKLDENADRYIHFAVDGAKRMQQLIEGLLAYSRLSRTTELAPVDTSTVFAEATANLAAAAGEAHAEITSDRLPTVKGDRTQLIQLFQNLIANGIKYRRNGVAPRVHVSAANKDGEWLFSVRDNGIGIDSGHEDRVFLIFQRLHTREEYPGTGIGLALCKRIVERHGGQIWFTSRPGEGTTFFFTIPGVSNGSATTSSAGEKIY